jgi:hypothetical protein
MNKAMQKQAAAKLPFSVLEVNKVIDHSAVLSLQGMEGAKHIPPVPPPIPPHNSTINKGRPRGTMKVNIASSNSAKLDCSITAIAKGYQCLV